MKTPTFKKGQWLISRWKKEYGGETDFCLFTEQITESEFSEDKFVRIKNDGSLDFKCEEADRWNNNFDPRKSLQWRVATKAELKKYSQLIFS